MADPTDAAQAAIARRTLLKGLGVAGVAAVAAPLLPTAPATAAATATPARVARPTPAGAAPPAPPSSDREWLDGFAAAVEAEFARQRLVAAGVALVSADRVLLLQPLGTRQATGRPTKVDADTHFFVASTTKSMSSLQVATWVDQGVLGWDQPVKQVWPGFRAPTDALTASLRVRDLLGMGSGLATGATDDLHQFETTAGQLLDLLASQAVLGPPDTVYNYNNAAYCAGGYLPLLKQGVRAEDLTSAWRQTERQRVWQPAGMTDTLAADDARGLVDNYATGNGFDVTGAVRSLPFVGTGSSSPAGAALSTLRDMAGYVRLQLRSGVAVTGRRVVSAANLAECWKGHVDANPDRTVFPQDPDAVSSHYAMGWLSTTYRDGTRLVWHNGAIDGFTTYIGFLPGKDIGLVVLNAMNPNPVGISFYDYVRNLLLNRYGLNQGAAQVVQRQYDQAIADLRAAGSGARRVPTATANGLAGYYERGYRLEAERGNLVVHSGPRSYTVEQAKDGGYVIADGFLPGAPVTFGTDPDGTPRMVLAGAEDVRRTGLL